MMGKARRHHKTCATGGNKRIEDRHGKKQAHQGHDACERQLDDYLALAGCGNGSCDNCSSCSLGAGDPYGTYQPYIDGEMEIADINMMVAERNAKLFGLQRG